MQPTAEPGRPILEKILKAQNLEQIREQHWSGSFDQYLAIIREHPGWIRVGRDGSHPLRTPYNWTPMSLTAPGWYDEVVYESLAMMARLGFSSVFQDGGYLPELRHF